MRCSTLISTLTCSASLLVFAAPALAGEQPQATAGTQVSNEPASSAADGESASTADIVVTGSRIARRDYSATSPIVTLGASSIASTGSPTIEQSLNQLPQITSSASSASSRNSRAGQSNVNLRGLGQQRTLVLLNDRRMQPSGSDGTVDLNIIPSALIDNVEIITGGASSTYGSDAVAGVVNIRLKKRFKGVQLDLLDSATFRGDAGNASVGLTGGTDFAEGRGNIFLSGSYTSRQPLEFRQRDYLRTQLYTTNSPGGLITAVSSNLPSQAALNTVFGRYGATAGSVPRSSTLSFNPDGTMFVGAGAINFRGQEQYPYTVYNNAVYTIAGDDYLAQVPMERYSMLGRAEFDVSDDLKLFVEGLYTHYTATNSGPPLVVGSVSSLPVSVPVTNPFIPQDLRTLLASRPNPNADFLLAQEIIPAGKRTERNRYNVYQVTVGAEGKIGGTDLTWNAYVSQGRTKLDQQLSNYPSSIAVINLVSAADGGRSLCAGGYNFVDIYSLSADCLNYIKREATNQTTLKQTVAEINLQGAIAKLPAGDLRFAIGADYRRNSYAYQPDALITSGELANFLPIFASAGSESVKEAYGELLVPLLRDLPLIDELSVNAGYRYSDYRASGSIHTFKVDADWRMTSFLRLRGGFARAVRAPSVGELYAAKTTGLVPLGAPGVNSFGSGDPCDVRGAYRQAGYANATQVRALCLAQGVPASSIDSFQNIVARTPFTTSGNLALEPEKSDTISLGFVIRPKVANPLFSNLSVSVDYYRIKLDKAIGTVTNLVATSQCFSTANNPTLSQSDFYCSLITRDPNTGQISNINNPSLNLGGYRTSGIDLTIDWTIPLDVFGFKGDAGRLSLGTVINYLDSFQIQTLPTSPRLDYAGTIGNQQIDFFATAHPKWKATSTVGYSVGPLQSSLRWRFIDKMSNASNVGTNGTAAGPKAVSYFDLDLGLKVTDNLELRSGVVNLTDRKPPQFNFNFVGNPASDLYAYDLLGRRFYVSAKVRF